MPEFCDELLSVMEKQYQLYEPYQSLCKSKGVEWPDIQAMIELGDLHAIPAIPTDWFKKNKGKGLFKELADLQKEGQWLVSSTTSGDPSYVWRTQADIEAIRDTYTRAYRNAPACKALAFSADADFLRKVGQRFAIDDNPVMLFATVPSLTAEEVFADMDYLVRLNKLQTLWTMVKTRGKGRPVLDMEERLLTKTIQDAEESGSRLVFASVVLMLYPTLRGLSRSYQLGANAYFVTGAGGWDGKKGTTQGAPIDKSGFVTDM